MQDSWPELDAEIKECALVHSAEDRMRIASLYTARIRLYEGQLRTAKEQEADSQFMQARIIELQRDISYVKGNWRELLGTEYPSLF